MKADQEGTGMVGRLGKIYPGPKEQMGVRKGRRTATERVEEDRPGQM